MSDQMRRASRISKLNRKKSLHELKRDHDTDVHLPSLKSLESIYQTDFESGLSERKAARVLREDGPNQIGRAANTRDHLTPLKYLVRYLFAPPLLLLWLPFLYNLYVACKFCDRVHAVVAGVLLAFLILPALAIVVLVRSRRVDFNRMSASIAKVVRDGVHRIVPSKSLVVGDVVEVAEGDIVPADVRIIRAEHLHLNSYHVTGNANVERKSEKYTDSDAFATENLAFTPSMVTKGRALCLVHATGDDTYLGHIANFTALIGRGVTRIESAMFYHYNVYIFLYIIYLVLLVVISSISGYRINIDDYVLLLLGCIPAVVVFIFVLAVFIIPKRLDADRKYYSFKDTRAFFDCAMVDVWFIDANIFHNVANARDLIKMMSANGVKVILLYNDSTVDPPTALKSARELGGLSPDVQTIYDVETVDPIQYGDGKFLAQALSYDAAIIDGRQLRHIATFHLEKRLAEIAQVAFVKLSPQQKYRVVEIYQRSGGVVAYLGDAICDLPAMKRSDVGVGFRDATVTMRVADLIVKRDRLTSLVQSITNGRLAAQMLHKVFTLVNVHHASTTLSLLAMAVFKFPPPLHASLVILIEIVSILLSLCLLTENLNFAKLRRLPERILPFQNLTHTLYGYYGMFTLFVAWMVYFLTMAVFGFLPGTLINTMDDERWTNSTVESDIRDIYGRVWPHDKLMVVLEVTQSAFFIAVLSMQFAAYLCAKDSLNLSTRFNVWSLVTLVLTVLLSVGVVFLRWCNVVFVTRQIPVSVWSPAVVFALIMILVDIWRKKIARAKNANNSC